MADLEPCRAAKAVDGPLLDRDHGKRTLSEWQHDPGRLPTGTLFNEDQFAAVEIDAGAIEQEYRLQRKVKFAVQILARAVVVAGAVTQHQRSGAGLACSRTTRDHRIVIRRPVRGPPQLDVSSVRDRR